MPEGVSVLPAVRHSRSGVEVSLVASCLHSTSFGVGRFSDLRFLD